MGIKYIQILPAPTEDAARNTGNNMKNEPQKPHQSWKYMRISYLKKIFCSACNPMQVVAFCNCVLIL